MCAPRGFIVALLTLVGVILIGVMLSACDETSFIYVTPTPTPCDVDFRDLVPTGWVPVNRFVVETGGLGPKSQCAVLYRVDAQDNPNKIAPVEGVIYRRDHGEPPRSILAYPLRLPGRFYLGEHNVNVYTGTLITNTLTTSALITDTGWPQVVVEDWDPAGIVVQISLFQWYDLEYKNPFAPYDPNKMGYKLVGWFMGEGGIQVGQNVITVAERITETRSRLAYQKVYTPNLIGKTWSYSQLENSFKRVNPDTVGMIAQVECKDPNAACYPERTVLAFYQDLHNEDALEGLMTPTAYGLLTSKNLKYGCSPDRSQVDRALVQDIKFQDGDPQSRVTITKGQCKSKDGRFTPMARVVWTLERNKEGKWQLNGATEFSK